MRLEIDCAFVLCTNAYTQTNVRIIKILWIITRHSRDCQRGELILAIRFCISVFFSFAVLFGQSWCLFCYWRLFICCCWSCISLFFFFLKLGVCFFSQPSRILYYVASISFDHFDFDITFYSTNSFVFEEKKHLSLRKYQPQISHIILTVYKLTLGLNYR